MSTASPLPARESAGTTSGRLAAAVQRVETAAERRVGGLLDEIARLKREAGTMRAEIERLNMRLIATDRERARTEKAVAAMSGRLDTAINDVRGLLGH
jgi:predicted  nucleic acid-binding Zn-ribbon protein